MISRRRFLAAALGVATAGSVGSSGCLTAVGAAETGFLSYKGIDVEWEHRGRSTSATLCWAWSDGRERVFGWVAEGYEDVLAGPADLRVSEAVDARLRRAFRGVTYELGFSELGSDHDLLGGDWYVARTSRREFDSVRFGDRAEVLFRFPRVRVIDVYRGAQGDPREWSHEIGTMDFEALHRDRGGVTRDLPVDRHAGRGTLRRPGRDNDH